MKQAGIVEEKKAVVLLKSILFSYLLTGMLLLVLAILLYRFGLGEKAVSVAVMVIYVGASFAGGLKAGRKLGNRRFLWGLAEGSAYFLILAILSLLFGTENTAASNGVVTSFLLCAGGGMMGGMLS